MSCIRQTRVELRSGTARARKNKVTRNNEAPEQPPVLLISVLALDEISIQSAIERIKKKISKRYSLVFVTSHEDFSPFLHHKVPFEYLPPHSSVKKHAQVLDWKSYAAEKWELIQLKWDAERVVVFGISPKAYILSLESVLVDEAV